MDEIEPKKKLIALSVVVRYFLGAFFLLFGIIEIAITNFISGLFFILAGAVIAPSIMEYVEDKYNFSISSATKIFIIFCFTIGAIIAVPTPTTDDHNEAIASAPADVTGSEKIEAKDEQTAASQNTIEVLSTTYGCPKWSNEQYPYIFLFGEKYVPLFSIDDDKIWHAKTNKLAKCVLDANEHYAIITGEALDLGEGYTLTAKQVDVEGKKIWLQLNKNSLYIDDEIVSVNDGGDYNTWNVMLDGIQGEDNILVFRVRVNQLFWGEVNSINQLDGVAQLDGLWLIDYANSSTLNIGDELQGTKLVDIKKGVDESNLGSLVFKSKINQNNTQAASSKTPAYATPTNEVKYDDEKWLSSVEKHVDVVKIDLENFSEAATNKDYNSLAKYSDLLYKDSQSALDENDLYSVSPSLQNAKEEYRLMMVQANWAAIYTTLAINALNQGNNDEGIKNTKLATEALESCSQHGEKFKMLTDAM